MAPETFGVWNLDFHEYMHYMYLPVRLPGTSLVLPRRLEFAREMVEFACANEAFQNNNWDYVYVTARRGFATPGNPLNRPGWHADGFGTEDINYVWTDRFPTWFAEQSFDGIDDNHLTSIDAFEAQIRDITIYADRTLMRLNPYVVHAAPEIPAPGGERSFFKISFSQDRYNLLGNSHNYGLDYEWEMYQREVVRNDPAHTGKDSR